MRLGYFVHKILRIACTSLKIGPFLFVALPTSSHYNLNNYGFGAGGASNGVSSHYGVSGISGEAGSGKSSSTTYSSGNGLTFTEQTNLPPAPSLQNTNTNYDKLNYVINVPTSNASDYLYTIAISNDSFVTTQYVRPDHTVGGPFVYTDYQTYAAWGGSGGGTIIGLNSATTYSIKVKAIHGKYTESAYSTVVSATTSNPSLVFSLSTDNQPVPPFTIAMNNLTANTTVSSPHNVQTTFSTNADFGGSIYVAGYNSGLLSSTVSHTIASVSGSLGAYAEGFGAQAINASQTSGSTFSTATLYGGSGDVVGVIDGSYRQIFNASGPIAGGQGSFLLKARISSITPAATDYSEILTVIAAASF